MAIGRLRCLTCGGDHRTDECEGGSPILVTTVPNHSTRSALPVPSAETMDKALQVLEEAYAKGTLVTKGFPSTADWRQEGYVWDEDLLRAAKAELMRRYRARKGAKL